jgi:hypothetical protein
MIPGPAAILQKASVVVLGLLMNALLVSANSVQKRQHVPSEVLGRRLRVSCCGGLSVASSGRVLSRD